MSAQLDSILNEGIQNGAAPGAIAIMVNRDGVVWEGAAGERVIGSGVNMTTDTVGAIFSMTKAITGAAAMQLVEQGKLDLDAPAGDVCPWLHTVQVLDGFDEDGQPQTRAPRGAVTLRHLLTHTSGFVYEFWNVNDARCREVAGAPSLFTLENAALEVPLAFDPGTEWEYGIGIDWAGKMVEQVSGMTLGEYFSVRLTGPLGMTDTAFEHTPSMLGRAAGVHARMPDGSFSPMALPPPEAPEFQMGGGGLHGTMRDYGRFIRMLLNDGELEGVRVLQSDTVATMSRNHIGDLRVKALSSIAPPLSNDAEFFPGEPKSWGLTFQINETAVHTGRPAGTLMWAGLANSFFWIDRKNGVGGAYLSQILPFGDEKSLNLFLELERAVYESLDR
ncbi:MAG: serine hydrolase [Gammaproteobacteria bacterium]|nr:serine hydrolase [Gammaproteobacteria bacterium]